MAPEQQQRHELNMRERNWMAMTGVLKVESFAEQEIVLETSLGMLTVRGDGLHIRHLDLEQGNLEMDGTIESFNYRTDRRSTKSWRRLLR